MRQSLQLVVPALAALVLVVWLISSGENGSTATATNAVEAATRAERRLGAGSVGSGDDEAKDARALRSETEAAPAALVAAPDTVRGREIIAIVGAARRRVSDVEMWWSDEPEGDASAGREGVRRHLWRGELDAFLSARATALVADAEQRFHLDAEAFKGVVVARAPGLFGWTEVERHALGPCYVALEPDGELLARVVDGTGAPVAGVGVALRQFWGGQHFNDHARVETDGFGIARLAHFRALIDGDWDFDGLYCVSIAEPLGKEVGQRIEITRPPLERIELVLPAVGVVELEVAGAAPGTSAALEVPAPGSAAEPEDRDEQHFSDGQRRLVDGKTRFPFVALGLEFVPWTHDEFGARGHERSRFTGPRLPGEVVTVRLQLEVERTRLAGRIVDENERALGQSRVHARLTQRAGPEEEVEPWYRSGNCDASGRFELEFPCKNSGSSDLHLDVRDPAHRHLGVAAHPLNLGGGSGVVELGDVRLQPLPIVASGRVENARGELVAGASVVVFEHSERRQYDGSLHEDWSSLSEGSENCDQTGRFEIRGTRVPQRIAVQARDAETSIGVLEARGGARELVVVLEHDGALAGKLLLSEMMGADYVHLSLEPSEGRVRSLQLPSWSAHTVDPSGEFMIRRLAPGSYDITVSLQGRSTPLARISGVNVRAGATERDPRLDPLDLRRAAELIEVTLLDAEGRDVMNAVRCTGDGAWDSEEYQEDWLMSGRLLLERNERPFWVVTDACVLERVDPATVGRELRLRRAPLVRVVLEQGLELPLDKVRGRLRCRGAGEARMLASCVEDELHFGPNAVAQGRVRRLGALEVELWLEGDSSVQLPVEIVSGGTLVDSPLPQQLTLRFSPQARDEAVEQARK